MIIDIIFFVLGALLLYYGAEHFILASKVIALKFNISPIVIGITLVAFGTSLPELIVSIFAVFNNGSEGLVIGNVVGSNIANIGLVLSISAFIFPFTIQFIKIKKDLFFLFFINLLLVVFIFLGDLWYLEGVIFLILLYIYCKYLLAKGQQDDIVSEKINYSKKVFTKIIFGIIALGLGAHFFILGAKGIALTLGVPPIIIGMSIVAIGTSLPELAASISAVKHGEQDFVIGNVIGSNIMNVAAVLGITLLLSPITVQFENIKIHLFYMMFLIMFLIFLIKLRGSISKYYSLVLMIIYISFIYINFQ